MINGQRLHQGSCCCTKRQISLYFSIEFAFYFFYIESNRYEQWTAPEYYQAANTNFQSNEEKRKKTVELENRREKLKGLLDAENKQYAKEIEGDFNVKLN